MSVSTPSDSAGTSEGLVGQGSPIMPDATGQQMPTDGAIAATTGQFGDVSAPPDAAEELAFSDDDLAFLQSDEVQQWIVANKPQGLWTEAEFQQHKAELQSRAEAQANTRVQQVERQAKEQSGIAAAQTEALVGALYQAWRDAGVEPNTPEWTERESQVRAFTQSRVDARKLQSYQGNEQRNATVAQYAQGVYGELREWGIDPSKNAAALNSVRDFLGKVQRGEFGDDPVQIAQAQSRLVGQIVRSNQQAAQPPQPVQQQPQSVPPQQPPRQQLGPMQSPRGAGGAGPRSFADIYDAGEKKLIEQYGGDITKVPQSAWEELSVNAAMQAQR